MLAQALVPALGPLATQPSGPSRGRTTSLLRMTHWAGASLFGPAWLCGCGCGSSHSLGIYRGASDLLKQGITLAMELQQAVVRQAVSLVEKKAITRVRVFRFAHLKNLSGSDLMLFTQPMALAKLGRFLVDLHVVRHLALTLAGACVCVCRSPWRALCVSGTQRVDAFPCIAAVVDGA